MYVSYLAKGDTPAYRCASLGKEKDKQRRALADRVSFYLKSEMSLNK
jgi:hypothetical protein